MSAPVQAAFTNPPPAGGAAPPRPRLGAQWKLPPAGAATLVVLAVTAVYLNALPTPFVFDDQFAVVENPSIRHLAQLGAVLSPPPSAAGAAGRPLVNLTLAVNYALGGLNPWGYHLGNLALHVLAVVILFALVRRTLGRRDGAEHATLVAAAGALVWGVHPLLTEAVTGVIQRDEVLGGLFYLLTLYGFARFAADGGKRWAVFSVLACFAGTAAKEIIVSAPLAVLLYDRTFVAGSWREAWHRRRGYYLLLAASWVPLAALMLTSRQRGGTVGFGLGVSSGEYLLTQTRALTLYLKLALWPHPLVIDYGTDLVRTVAAAAWPGAAILLLVGATVAGVVRGSAAGFLGACFFAVLAPSSSLVPLVSQPIAEHRMYLPLAALIVLVVAGLAARGGGRTLLLWPVAALVLGVGTVRRNLDYRSEVVLTQGALAANPRNDRAWLNLGTFASHAGKTAEAIADYQQALRLNAGAADTHFDLAAVLEQAGRDPEAVAQYREAVRLRPAYPVAQYRLGRALARAGQDEAALGPLGQALALQPESPAVRGSLAEVERDLGNAAAQAGRLPEAIHYYEAALRDEPSFAQVHNNLANVLSQLGRGSEAIAHYTAAVQLRPDYAEAQYNLASELLHAGRAAEARPHLAAAVRLQPGDAAARRELERLDAAEK